MSACQKIFLITGAYGNDLQQKSSRVFYQQVDVSNATLVANWRLMGLTGRLRIASANIPDNMVGRIFAAWTRMNEGWERVTKGQLAGFVLAFVAFITLLLRSEPGFIFALDHANLLFHEAGHPIIGIFSTSLEPYGGTVGQLAFPVILAVSFWRKGQPVGVAASSIWFFENWFNIAGYMADARRLELPLVGGGVHDWNTILLRWDALQWDTRIAGVLNVLAWAGIGLTCAWFAWRVWKGTHGKAGVIVWDAG